MATSNEPADQLLNVVLGSDVVIRCTLGSDVTGYTFKFVVTDATGVVSALTQTLGDGISVVGAASAGVIDVTLLEADTETLRAGAYYRWGVWRTNTGAKHKLAGGPFVVAPAPEYAVV